MANANGNPGYDVIGKKKKMKIHHMAIACYSNWDTDLRAAGMRDIC